jgi:serine/threonine protein kinase
LSLIEIPSDRNKCDCYMLFPYYPQSLRLEINRRIFLPPSSMPSSFSTSAPWADEVMVLRLYLRILHGVQAMHVAGFSHRDIKPENILLKPSYELRSNANNTAYDPVLMDFGSVGPLYESIATRHQVRSIVEHASQYCTLPYRAPELFDGGVNTGDSSIDFTKVDVWSLGCVLFAILFGYSPFEMEFIRTSTPSTFSSQPYKKTASLLPFRVVECTQLRTLGAIPTPFPGTPPATWYRSDFLALIHETLSIDRSQRPTLDTVIRRVEGMILSREARLDLETERGHKQFTTYSDEVDNPGISLISSHESNVT